MAMLFLVHHAQALGSEVDPQRPLSSAGRLHADQLAARVAAAGVKPAAIWHSGKLRAKQTAEAFRSACNPLAEFTAIRGLQPDDPPGWIRDRVVGEQHDIMLVGHLPSLPAILRLLLGDVAEFPPHGVVALEERADGWQEIWRME